MDIETIQGDVNDVIYKLMSLDPSVDHRSITYPRSDGFDVGSSVMLVSTNTGMSVPDETYWDEVPRFAYLRLRL